MKPLTRRGMFTAFAGAGAAFAVPGAVLASTSAAPKATSVDTIVERARAAASASAPLPRPDAITARARVALCRAWDHQVYLIVDDRVHGFVAVDPRTFALAVAAQLVNQPLAIQYWGHRDSGNGTGAFEGVLVAADPRDLPQPDVVG
jgi:hypothetical protein